MIHSLPASPTFGLDTPIAPARRSDNHIGFHRALPGTVLDGGAWSVIPGGTQVWRISVRSPGALSLRLHLLDFSVGRGKVFVFAPGDTAGESVQGPYSGFGPIGDGSFWSGIVDGDTAVIDYQPEGSQRTSPYVWMCCRMRLRPRLERPIV